MNVILELLLRAVRFVIDKISDVIYFILYEESSVNVGCLDNILHIL